MNIKIDKEIILLLQKNRGKLSKKQIECLLNNLIIIYVNYKDKIIDFGLELDYRQKLFNISSLEKEGSDIK